MKLMNVLDQYTESRDCRDGIFASYDRFRECVYLPPTAHSWHCLSGCALESKPAFLDVNDKQSMHSRRICAASNTVRKASYINNHF